MENVVSSAAQCSMEPSCLINPSLSQQYTRWHHAGWFGKMEFLFLSYFPYTQSLFSSPVLDLLYLMSSVAKKATGLLHARRPRILQHNNNSGAWAARVQHIGSTEVQEVQNKRAVSHAAGERHDGFQAPVFCIQSEAMQ